MDWHLLTFIAVIINSFRDTNGFQKRVIGGELAPPDKYRWAVSIIGDIEDIKSSGACGASIINTVGKVQWLVTASHCFFPKSRTKNYDLTKPSMWHARIGLTKVDFYYKKHGFGFKLKKKLISLFRKAFQNFNKNHTASITTADIHIKKIFIHPKYRDDILEYDIALMKLDQALPVDQLKGVNTISLPDESVNTTWPPINAECAIVGWGCTKAAGVPNRIAKLALLKIWENEKCTEAFNADIGLNPNNEFCAGYLKKKYGLCPGDSGSGLACDYKGKWTLAGVVSAAHSTEPGEYPALFSRISSYKQWITDIIENN